MKNLKLSMLILLSISIMSCSKDSDNNIEPGISQEILSKIESMGFDANPASIIVTKLGYIVEGDILIPKESLEKDYVQKQHVLNVINCATARNVRIKNELGDHVSGDRFGRALKLWNDVGGASTLNLVAVNKNPDIVVRLAENNEIGNAFGSTTFPVNGVPSPVIFLRPDSSYKGQTFNALQWSNIIAHEIGHALGILHTNMSGDETIHIPGTPDIDNQERDELSIMTDGMDTVVPFDVVLNSTGPSLNDKRTIRLMFHENANRRLCN